MNHQRFRNGIFLIVVVIMMIIISSCKKDEEQTDETKGLGLEPTPANIYSAIPSASSNPYSGSLPSSYFLSFPPSGNQGSEGSCVSWATGYGLMGYYLGSTNSSLNNNKVGSPEYIFNQTQTGDCNGSYFVTVSGYIGALDLLVDQGVCTWNQMPYSSTDGCTNQPNSQQTTQAQNNKLLTYQKVTDLSASNLKQYLYTNHPIIIGVKIDDSFINADENFVWSSFDGNEVGRHALVITGYDDGKTAFQILNSWSSSWGDNGYSWIDYSFVDECVFEAYITYPKITTTNTGACDSLVDSRDGHVYHVVKIGNQCWMAENLEYDAPGFLDLCYENNSDSCAIYGKYYKWSTAMNGSSSSNSNPSSVQGVCPNGWHIPGKAEWEELFSNFPNGYLAYNSLALDGSTGFNARLGGYYLSDIGSFEETANVGWFLTSTEQGDDWFESFALFTGDVMIDVRYKETDYIPCRCVKD